MISPSLITVSSPLTFLFTAIINSRFKRNCSNGPMRSWLRARITSVDSRVYFSVPRQDSPAFPFLVMYRVGGLPDNHTG